MKSDYSRDIFKQLDKMESTLENTRLKLVILTIK